LPRGYLIAVVEGMYPQLREILGTELHDGDRLVHAADDGALFLKDLHQHVGMLLIRTEYVDRPIEVDVAVIAFADPFHREPEDGRINRFRRRAGGSVTAALPTPLSLEGGANRRYPL